MSETRPLSDPDAYVDERRDDLVYLLKHGDGFVRALALTVLLMGGDDNDWELVEREVQLAKEVGDDALEEVF